MRNVEGMLYMHANWNWPDVGIGVKMVMDKKANDPNIFTADET